MHDELRPCSHDSCPKFVHLTCYNGMRMKLNDFPQLPGDLVACTKKCAVATIQSTSSAANRKPSWENDSKGGDDDPTSIQILIDWMTKYPNYEKYRGKCNAGKKKKEVQEELAKEMREKTLSTERDWKQVSSKIKAIAEQWRNAYDWTHTETGAGLLEADTGNNNSTSAFKDAVMKRCKYYYDLHDIMINRASTTPKTTSYSGRYNLTSSDDDDEDDDNSTQAEMGNAPTDTIAIDDDGSPQKQSSQDSVVSSSAQKARPKKRKSSSSSISDVSVYGNSDMAGVMAKSAGDRKKFKKLSHSEEVRHHQKLETIQERKLELGLRKQTLDEQKFQFETERMKISTEKDAHYLRDQQIKHYEEYVKKGYSNKKILRLFPALKDVVEAFEEEEEDE
ncbi:MAG: hypothetical protein SGILL_001699 [Bacillariaceae sp.]